MSPAKIATLVSETVALDREIREKTAELKERKASLCALAVAHSDEATPTEGGGKSITFTGTEGSIARVTFPGASLKAKLDGESKVFPKIKEAAGKVFDRLFRPAISYRPVENFRDEAAALLGKGADKLIRLCSGESAPSVSFETKDGE